MTEKTERTGGCLCGAVRFTATTKKPSVSVCHCSMCRRWSSAPFMALNSTDIRFEGAENITRFRSSDWAERGFCARCGSDLFYHIVGSDAYQMAAGAFDDPADFRLSLQVFIDEKPGFYAFANGSRTMTGAEVVAAFVPSNDSSA